MKNFQRSTNLYWLPSASAAALFEVVLGAGRLQAANDTWTGAGRDNYWLTGANWLSGVPPVATDSLFFSGTTRLTITNNLGSGTAFNGNSITLGGNITDNQVVTPEVINLALALNATRTVIVNNNASLTLGGVISGAFGLTKDGGGLLTLGAANTFTGPLSIFAGTVFVSSDSNLGAIPGAFTPISIIISTSTLRTTNSFT